MQTQSLNHVSVWLDGSSSDEPAFSTAMDWACRLHLPLRAIVRSSRTKNTSGEQRPESRSEDFDENHGYLVKAMKTWVDACTQRGIVLDMVLSLEMASDAMGQFLASYGLCVLVEDTSSPVQQELLVRSARNHEIAVALCPPKCVPMTRMMVLHHRTNSSAVYLENAARLCNALEIHPIILIVADTEREADLRQGYAEAVCKSFRLLADFDIVVGSDPRSAVGRVASWRSCSHLIIERRTTSAWWHFANGDLLKQLRGVSDSLSILALPDALTLEAPRQIHGNPLKLPVGCYAETNPKSNKEYA